LSPADSLKVVNVREKWPAIGALIAEFSGLENAHSYEDPEIHRQESHPP
jgi:hypothetical protein